MIREALLFVLTPATPVAKKYGFLYQSIALKARYERCRKAWLPHLKNCQDLFLEALADLPQKKSVVILGSAHLHEIPLHLLVDNFEKITLVDVIHPWKHHWLAKRNSRLTLVTEDLSQSLLHLDNISSFEELQQWATGLINKKLFSYDADLIVSGNILSQLALLPIESLEKKLKQNLSAEQKDIICTAFAEAHLKSLSECKGKKLIYADRVVTYRDKDNEIIYEGHYPVNFAGFTKLKEWIWNIAPLREAAKDYSIEMKVESYFSG